MHHHPNLPLPPPGADISNPLARPAGEAFDDGERAANIAEQDRQIALAARRLQHEMLESQDIDKHGVVWCLGCPDPIPLKRLEAVPHAVRCADCQEEFELRHFQATGKRRL